MLPSLSKEGIAPGMTHEGEAQSNSIRFVD